MSLHSINLSSSTGPKLTGLPDLTISGEITEVYQIFVDDRSESNIAVANYLPLTLFSPHPESNMFVQTFRDVEYKQHINQPFHGSEWEGTLKYTRRARTKPSVPQEPSPNDPYQISFNFSHRQEVLSVDRYGNFVKNSAGDLYDSPPTLPSATSADHDTLSSRYLINSSQVNTRSPSLSAWPLNASINQ